MWEYRSKVARQDGGKKDGQEPLVKYNHGGKRNFVSHLPLQTVFKKFY